MNKDLHTNNDDLYRKAYEQLEEDPSADVWDKVAAKLDSRDARYYQQKSIRWKRTSLLLLLLLGTVLLTGILYIATKKETPPLADTKENYKDEVTGNNAPILSRSNDSSIFSQNINQHPIYATEQNRKSHPGSDASTLSQTPAQPLDKIPQQMGTRSGKQYPQPLQDSSVAGKEAIALQQVPAPPNNPYTTKQITPERLAAQKNTVLPGRKKETAYRQRPARKMQPGSTVFAPEERIVSNRNGSPSSSYHPGSLAEDNEALLLLHSLNLNSFSTSAILHKESVDSNTLVKAGELAATQKKEATLAEAAGSKKVVKIKPLLKRRLQLTGYASLDASEYHLDDDDDHNNNNQQPASHREDRHKIKDRESHGLSFSAGIAARLQVAKNLSLKSGLNYSSIAINSNPQTLYAAQNGTQGVAYKFITSSGYAYIKLPGSGVLSVGDSATTGTSQQQLQFLSVPLMAGYTLYSSRSFSITPSVGAAANFLLGTNVKTEINEPAAAKESVTLTHLNGLQSWYASLLADAEIQYYFRSNMSLTFLPSFRYAISPLTQNNAVKTSPYNFGLGLGFTYHF